MMKFMNTGADEAILKSIPTDGCSEDLIKAMNKQGLVQKDVTVQGKNGKVFTRKQWVKASDIQGSGSNFTQQSQITNDSRSSVEINGKKYYKTTAGNLKCGMVIPDNVDKTKLTKKVIQKTTYVTKGQKRVTGQTKDIVTGNLGFFDFSYFDRIPFTREDTPQSTSQPVSSQNSDGLKSSIVSSSKKTLDPAYFESIKSDKPTALKYLKDCGVSWTEHSHAGINWMRAMAAYKAAMGNQNSTQTASKTSTQLNSQPALQTVQPVQNSQTNGNKMSKEDAKKKTQSYTNKVGKSDAERKSFMDKVKAQGITWKDKADDGSDVAPAVNWMRCCMAMNKHFAEGGSFDDSDKSAVSSTSTSIQQSDTKSSSNDKTTATAVPTRYIDSKVGLGSFGTKNYSYAISMKAKVTDTKENGKRIFTPVDDSQSASFQVGDNYGNCFYMSRKDGNKLFEALKNDTIKRDVLPPEMWRNIQNFLDKNNIKYKIGCSRP